MTLDDLMRRAGIVSFAALAARSGVNATTLYLVKNRRRPPRQVTVDRLAVALRCQPADIIAALAHDSDEAA